MKHVFHILITDLKRRMRSPMSILVLLLIPLMMTGIMGSVFAPGVEKHIKVKVLLADRDGGGISKLMIHLFSIPDLKKNFRLTEVSESAGRKLLSKGEGSLLVVIPEGFSESVSEGNPMEMTVIKNPSQQFLPVIGEEFFQTLSVVLSGLIRVFEVDHEKVARYLEANKEALTPFHLITALNSKPENLRRIASYINPLLIQLKSVETGKKEKRSGLNLFSYILPGISIMFLLFIIEVFLREILSDREDGKLQRMMFSPLRPIEFITARILSGWIMGILCYLVVVVMGIAIFKIDWGNPLYLFIFISLACFWIASFFALMNGFFKNRNQAGAFSAPIIMVFSVFGGSILPVDQLPGSLSWVSNLTLNHWFIQGAEAIRGGLFPLIPVLVIGVSGFVLYIGASIFLLRKIKI